VIIANRSSRALALLNTNPTIEVVLLDHELLGMKASELVRKIKLRRPHLSIILVSACDSVVQDAVKFVEGAVIKGSDAFANVLNQLQLLTAARLNVARDSYRQLKCSQRRM
jgi:response regulator RpfG family c-di-GMP phosphodiesterase